MWRRTVGIMSFVSGLRENEILCLQPIISIEKLKSHKSPSTNVRKDEKILKEKCVSSKAARRLKKRIMQSHAMMKKKITIDENWREKWKTMAKKKRKLHTASTEWQLMLRHRVLDPLILCLYVKCMQKACKRMENCMQIAFEKIYYVFSIGWHSIWKAARKRKREERKNQLDEYILHQLVPDARSIVAFVFFVRRLFSSSILVYCFATRSSCRSQSKLQIAFIDPNSEYTALTMLHAKINLFICENRKSFTLEHSFSHFLLFLSSTSTCRYEIQALNGDADFSSSLIFLETR